MIDFPIPIIGFSAFSGTGKTTLLRKLIPLLTAKGIRVGMVKHSHHDIDVDHPGKDSYVLRKAGASQMVLASPKRTSIIIEHPEEDDSRLFNALRGLQTEKLDLVLVEGFKHEKLPKIELHRKELGKPLLYPEDSNIIAVVTDYKLEDSKTSPTKLRLEQPQEIADFIISYFL